MRLMSRAQGVGMRGLGPLMSSRFAAALAVLVGTSSAAMSQPFDFFNQRPERHTYVRALPYGTDGGTTTYSTAPAPMFGQEPSTRIYIYRKHRETGHQEQAAFCVRTCDGRYFPAATLEDLSRAETCKNFCPASETRIFYGATID